MFNPLQEYAHLKETMGDMGAYFAGLSKNLEILKQIKPFEKVNLNTLVMVYDVVSEGNKAPQELLMGEIGYVRDIHWTTVMPTTSTSLDSMLMSKTFGFNDDKNIMEIFLNDNTLSIPVEFDERRAKVSFWDGAEGPEFTAMDKKHSLVGGNSIIAVNPYEINASARKVAPGIECITSDFFKYLKD